MERRALIAVLLSILVMVVWSWLFPPAKPPQPLPAQQPAVEGGDVAGTTPSSAAAEPRRPDEAAAASDDPAVTPAEEPPVVVEAAGEETVQVETSHATVTLTNRGGVATSWKLLDYTTADGEMLELVGHYSDSGRLPLAIELDDAVLMKEINSALFTVEREVLLPEDGDGAGTRVTFRWSDGRDLEARKIFTFRDDSWLTGVDIEVLDRGRPLPVRLAIGPGFSAQEPQRGASTYAYRSQAVWNLDGEVTRRKKRKLVKQDGGVSGGLLWAGLEDQYFAALVIPSRQPASARWRMVEVTPTSDSATLEDGDDPEQDKQPIVSVSVDAPSRIFMGPKDYRLLQQAAGDVQLEKAVWFATNSFLAWITRQIYLALLWIQAHVVSNYGVAIILATLALRILLFPLNQYSMVAMRKTQMQMQRIQPKVNAIRNKYKKAKDAQSRAKMNEETMALYKREGVNPMGGITGCLPMLAQFPILIGFYNMLTVAVELRGAPFALWIQDLSQKDPFYLIPIAMAATMFLQQKMAMNKVKDPMQQQQQKIMMIMPFFFGWICMQMPAGMVLYWFVNNVLGIGQQWLVNRTTGRLEAAPQKA